MGVRITVKQNVSLYILKSKLIGFREEISNDKFYKKLEVIFKHKSLLKGYILYGPIQFVNNLCGTNITFTYVTVQQIKDIDLPKKGCEISLKLNDEQFEENTDEMFHEKRIIYAKGEEVCVSYCEHVNDVICKMWFECKCPQSVFPSLVSREIFPRFQKQPFYIATIRNQKIYNYFKNL